MVASASKLNKTLYVFLHCRNTVTNSDVESDSTTATVTVNEFFLNLFIHLQNKVHTNTELQRITN